MVDGEALGFIRPCWGALVVVFEEIAVFLEDKSVMSVGRNQGGGSSDWPVTSVSPYGYIKVMSAAAASGGAASNERMKSAVKATVS